MKKNVFALLIAVSFLGAPAAFEQQPAAREEAGAGIAAFAKGLASADHAQREKTADEIEKHEDAVAILRVLMKSEDRQAAKRAGAILEELMRPGPRRHLEKAREYGAEGKIDLACEHLARLRRGQYEEQSWKIFLTLMYEILERGKKQTADLWAKDRSALSLRVKMDRLPRLRTVYPNRMPEILVAPKIELDGANNDWKWVRADDVNVSGNVGQINSSMILATRRFNVERRDPGNGNLVNLNFIYAGEQARLPYVHDSILVCDGDIRFKMDDTGFLSGFSIIIARGNITFDYAGANGGPVRCLVAAGKTVNFLGDSTAQHSEIIECEHKPFGFLRFFEVSDLGVNLIQNGKWLRVNTVDKNSPFARAGLEPLDKILEVDGKEIRTYEAFRRYVRSKWISEEPMALRIDSNAKGGVNVKVEWPNAP